MQLTLCGKLRMQRVVGLGQYNRNCVVEDLLFGYGAHFIAAIL